MKFKTDNYRKIIILLTSLISLIAWGISYMTDTATAYNDSMAHLNLARMVLDNLHPGFSQLGGVWLPLNHILFLPLIWNNWAWTSGFAGSIISMISYVVSVVLVFESVRFISRSKIAGLIGAAAFALNVNILYLQTTPLTEPLFLMLFLASFYFFTRWVIGNKTSDLIRLALTGFFLVLCRYDGWFVAVAELALIGIYKIVYDRKRIHHIFGIVFVASLPMIYGILLWVIWNKLIFGHFLYFVLGPYSAHAQQSVLSISNNGLITKGNIGMSFLAYYYTVKDNIGLGVIALSAIGTIFFLYSKNKLSVIRKLLIIAFLLSPVLFNILSLYMGFSIVNVPELKWNPSFNPSGSWFNVRYGIFALPLIAVLTGLIIHKSKFLTAAILSIIIFQAFYFVAIDKNIITVTDGLMGSSRFQNPDIAKYLKSHIHNNDKILLSISYFSPVVFKSQFNFSQVIHEGTGNYWEKALYYPFDGPDWIVMSNGSRGDPVYNTLIVQQKRSFLSLYKIAYTGVHANIYKSRSENELFISRIGIKLKEGRGDYKISGINSFDLAYKSKQQITDDFKNFKKSGINTVRFWAFGDGMEGGFQPQAGITNENRLKNLDFILALASKNNIRIIPVLVNNGTDFGGKSAYVRWIGQDTNDYFFTDNSDINLYKNYINKILSRKNTLTGTYYYEDPAVLAWDIMNDPQVDDPENNSKLKNWANDIGWYIKQKDKNHLVTIGTGQASMCYIKSIDICSTDLNLKNSNLNAYNQTQITIAEVLKKPIIYTQISTNNLKTIRKI